MSWENDIFSLMYSDFGAVGVEELTSQFGLWVRNSIIHLWAGYVGFHQWFYHPDLRGTLQAVLIAYCLLQVVQLWTPGDFTLVALDSAWDIVAVAIGISWAWSDAMRGVPK
ncbi:hypothetical protein [Pelagimonas varians]|uniref:VanZ-like domain-containing protein n=1 Tax=Pelagimonas varians TaxID=696760 RepID=A0A238KCJ5_9RHOB|nr:hypothetical protein [Pelagimonas varians]PYG29984.1 hypothetical protein C8N36_107150 [Pelagimonas varians]SMX40568.1 hypothetical protein PEV8663_02045 [Pelagimonas varians]